MAPRVTIAEPLALGTARCAARSPHSRRRWPSFSTLATLRLPERSILFPYLVTLFALAFLLGATACGDDERLRLDVAAAADLRDAFAELVPLFEPRCGCDVRVTLGSSGRFATQIRQGLPVDAFFSASEEYVESLAKDGLVKPESMRLYAIGHIVIAVSQAVGEPPASLEDLLDPAIRRVAIPNPDYAPYGGAARQALQSAGVWEAVQPKLVFGENAAQTAEFVESRSADVGILPLSLTIQRHERLRYVLVDDDLYDELQQTAAVVSRSREPQLAAAFIAFVVEDAAAREIMRKYGFNLPGERPQP